MTVPVFLVILPAGALADLVDRRRFLLLTQGWMVLASACPGNSDADRPHLSLDSCCFSRFLLGLGAVMNDPAWQAITPEVVSPGLHAPAVALNSVGFNVARAVGPALGGMVIAATSSGVAFLLNAASFFGVIFFLYRWKRPHVEHVETGRVRDALWAGFRYVRGCSAGALSPDSHRGFQPGGKFAACAVADSSPALRRSGLWPSAGIIRPRRARRGGGASEIAQPVIGRRHWCVLPLCYSPP